MIESNKRIKVRVIAGYEDTCAPYEVGDIVNVFYQDGIYHTGTENDKGYGFCPEWVEVDFKSELALDFYERIK